MRHGLDTSFLVAVVVAEHPSHSQSREKLASLIAVGDTLALAPQVLAEFLHIVTDARRFSRPLIMEDAIRVAEQWWTACEVTPVFPDVVATGQFLAWMQQHALGRKRLLDTLLAATYRHAGVSSVLTTNSADFAIFGCFQAITP